jgi:hypothetical protein
MTRLLSLLLNLPLILLLLAAFGLGASLEPAPRVSAPPGATAADVERVRQLLRAQDPRDLAPGATAHLTLPERDLNLALGYLLRSRGGGAGRLDLGADQARAAFSWPLPAGPGDHYLNLGLDLNTDTGRARITGLRLGATHLPLDLDGDWLARRLLAWLGDADPGRTLTPLQQLHSHPGRLELAWRWDPEQLHQARDLALPAAERERVAEYRRWLDGVVRTGPGTLPVLLGDTFRRAAAASAEASPVAENRAALVALGLYALGRNLENPLPGRQLGGGFAGPGVTLRGREDLARHYLISAALAAAGDTALADAVGLYKELDDSRGGSGFSFIDLAADRAGTRLGQRATAGERPARRVQEALSAGLADGELLPSVADLPEGLQQDALAGRLGGPGAARFEQLRREIERRLDRLALYQTD